MRNIIVVDCQSTAINFIDDIYNRRYNPIVLELKSDVKGYREKMDFEYERSDYDFEIIHEKDSYDETLDMVRELDPLVILAGTDDSVDLVIRLSDDLNLLSNFIDDIDAITIKDERYKRFAQKGLRYIKSKVVTSLDEAIDFYDDESLTKVSVQSLVNSTHNICYNKEEMIDAVNKLIYDTNSAILIKEFINGDEYIVNTTSCDGVHRITTIWKCNKVTTDDGIVVYDTIESLNDLEIGEAEMIDYAYDVADALRVQYGPVSGEYMIDRNGPILMDVHCCPMAGHFPRDFLNKVSGQHETDSILDSYLKPDRFIEKRKQSYRLPAYGALKFIIAPKDIIAKSAPMNNISPRLNSFYSSVFDDLLANERFYPKTEDSETTCGLLFLANEDYLELHNDIRFLHSVEKNAFDLVLSEELDENPRFNKDVAIKKLQLLIDMTQKYGNGLLITDQILYDVDIMQVRLNEVGDINGEFDYVIINLNQSFVERSDYMTIDTLLDIFSHIKVEGYIYIPETTYRYVPGGRKGIEALLKALNLRIEVPPYGIKSGVIASKNG